ncbi:MAG: 50S ribosome-binding GTPase [Prolixibacteraceae bacterium]|nr:50S ribosome-binding GTPase [Prolixibacteraceae bacterium]MBN2648389.1 50S ribosome-binding GTPase [Prolixibacteraceae bacterium]
MQVNREHIGLFGKMNSGKSTLMNLLTQQETSIADPTPGTTADTKVAFMELHGLGPVKLFDTAGLDEPSNLGVKKKQKVLAVLKECDLVLLIVDASAQTFEVEYGIIEAARELDKQILVVFNLFNEICPKLATEIAGMPQWHLLPHIELRAIDSDERSRLINFILRNYQPKSQSVELLPFVQPDEFYILNIPMDEETPDGRFLRPQSMALEAITRKWAYPIAYRMDLKTARSEHATKERERFEAFLAGFSKKPKAVITDSQAMDIMATWMPDDILLSTFSIMMINYGSNGALRLFYDGVQAMNDLQPSDKILIAEACNHSRIQEDIGTVQIPTIIKKRCPGVAVEFNFGREFQLNEKLSEYRLIIHCGGCMISTQKLQARLRDLRSVGVPITNYGVFLSWAQGSGALERVMKPWLATSSE